MQHDVLVDGVEAEGGWLNERAFQFGDGLFETIAVIDREPCLWDAHMARLAEGCRRLRLPLPDSSCLARECRDLCAGQAQAVLKVYWTAGQSERGYGRPVTLKPKRIIRRSAWARPAAARHWVVRQCTHRLGENPTLAGIKHLNRLDQVIGRSEWTDPAIDEGLMLGQDGRVVCGTMSNLFLQYGEHLATPAVDGAGVAGTVRDLVLKLAERTGHTVDVAALTPEQVHAADAIYLTNSLIGVVRVRRYESTELDPGRLEHPVMIEVRRLCHQGQPLDFRRE
ncbi:MAG: aminodeoxychorismate lyase [Sedimenticolaceae bacterium]